MLQRVLFHKEDFTSKVKKHLGSLRFLYYRYLENFHQFPKDLDDIVDGIIYVDLVTEEKKNRIQEEASKKNGK